MGQSKQKVGGGGRKLGRNKAWCEVYRQQGRREKNRKIKWLRTLKRSKSPRGPKGERLHYMNRAVALRLHDEHRTKFHRSPLTEMRGPYVPV